MFNLLFKEMVWTYFKTTLKRTLKATDSHKKVCVTTLMVFNCNKNDELYEAYRNN